jgi:hypothetical protein
VIAVSYSLKGAAEATGISERTLSDAIASGDLVTRTLTDKPGSKKVIFREDLEEYVKALPVWKPAA